MPLNSVTLMEVIFSIGSTGKKRIFFKPKKLLIKDLVLKCNVDFRPNLGHELFFPSALNDPDIVVRADTAPDLKQQRGRWPPSVTLDGVNDVHPS